MKFFVTIDGKTYENCVVFPFNFENALDATLDSATLQIERVPIEVIEPLTDITVKVQQEEQQDEGYPYTEFDYIVSSDESYESPVGSELYTHFLQLVELTKYGEGFIGDSLCVTHPGGNVYTENAYPVTPKET